jgi:hypothetical protein
MLIRDLPILTQTFDTPSEFVPEDGSAYIYSSDSEERTDHNSFWKTSSKDIEFVKLRSEEVHSFFSASSDVKKQEWLTHLYSEKELGFFWDNLQKNIFYLDITGMDLHIWAPLLKAGIRAEKIIYVIYAEANRYRISDTPTEMEIFDLSERIRGISPIPGFVSFFEAKPENVCLIPLLGFQGNRFSHVIQMEEPLDEQIFPVVSLPGLRPEYCFFTYWSNIDTLKNTSSWKNVKNIPAFCPFSIFYLLDSIANSERIELTKVALIGTKPHCLGGILFALLTDKEVELIYDYPIKKLDKIEGISKLHVYEISNFCKSFTKL